MASPTHAPLFFARGGNLPAELTPFIGRRRERAEIRQELERARLVTLCGFGGVGKTRLALKVAEEVRQHFADGCWIVELSASSSVQQVPRVVVDALEILDGSGADPVDLLTSHLADKRVLLVLDTCEHVADACAMLVEVLLRAAPGLQVIATSRRPLAVPGEHTHQVHPFRVPDAAAVGEPSGEAIELFVERVRAVLPGFELSPTSLPEVAEVCRRLDGIALALELAAMRLRGMSLSQLLERLDQRFRVLGGMRAGGGRQQTLRTMVRWSYELCDEAEQLLWARLAVFHGTFDLTAAESVCGDDRLPSEEILDTLTGLVEKSIVTYDPHAGRYRMLDSIREYAHELLNEQGELEELRRRHRDTYRTFVERAVERWCGGGQVGLFETIRQAMPNLRAAFAYSLSTPGEERIGLDMVSALYFFWFEALEFGTGREWLGEALSRVREPCLERGWGLMALSYLEIPRGEFERSLEYLDEATTIAESEPDSTLLGHAELSRGGALVLSGRVDEGLAALERAMAAFEEHGIDDPHAVVAPGVKAGTHTFLGEFSKSFALLEQCLPLCVERRDLWGEGFILFIRGLTHWMSRDPAAALPDLERCVELKGAVGDIFHVALAFEVYAFSLIDLGEPQKAALMLGAADGLWKRMEAKQGPLWDNLLRESVEALLKTMSEGALAKARARGAALSVTDALLVIKGERPASAPPPGRSPLTKRELEIAHLVAQGLSNRQIAERLVISKRTADSHLEHILTKLGFISRAQIAAWAATTERPGA